MTGMSRRVVFNNKEEHLGIISVIRNNLNSIDDEELIDLYETYDNGVGVYKNFAMGELHNRKEFLTVTDSSHPISIFIKKVTDGTGDVGELLGYLADATEELDYRLEGYGKIKSKLNSEEIDIDHLLTQEQKEDIIDVIELYEKVVEDQLDILSFLLNGESDSSSAYTRLMENESYLNEANEALAGLEDKLGIDDDVRESYGIT